MEGSGSAAASALHTKLNNLRVAASNGDETLRAVVTLLDGICFALKLQPPVAPEAYLSGILALLEGAGASKAKEVRAIARTVLASAESEHGSDASVHFRGSSTQHLAVLHSAFICRSSTYCQL